MILFLFIGLGLAVVAPILTWVLGQRLITSHDRDLFDHLAAIQAVVTVTALVFGGLWFVFERPNAAKLEIQQTANAVPLDDGRVLVLTEIGLKNIGGAALDLRGQEILYWIQRVTPVPELVAKDVARPPTALIDIIRPGDDWGVIASLDQRSATDRSGPSTITTPGELDTYIEAGDTENLYFRAVLPCTPNLRVYVTLRMAKPSTWFDGAKDGEMWWIKQTYLDLSAQCETSTGEPGDANSQTGGGGARNPDRGLRTRR